jgi:hypothetical protein
MAAMAALRSVVADTVPLVRRVFLHAGLPGARRAA